MEKEFKPIGSRQDVTVNYLNYQDAYQSAFLAMIENPEIIQAFMDKYQVDQKKAFNLLVKRTTENKKAKQKTVEKYELLQADFINLNDAPEQSIFDVEDKKQSHETERRWAIEHLLSFMKSEQKQLFKDYYVRGLTLEEIATAKGLTKPAIFYQVKQIQKIIDKSNVRSFYSEDYCNAIGKISGKKLAVEQNYRLKGDKTTIPGKLRHVKIKARNKSIKRSWKARQKNRLAERTYLLNLQSNGYCPQVTK